MKNKGKYFSIVALLSLTFSVISTNIFGQRTYTCNIKEGDEFIFTVTKLHTEYAEEFGMTAGDKNKIKITDITDEGDYFDIGYDYWDWVSKGANFSSLADYESHEEPHKDPSAYWENGPFYFVLTPVSDYLVEFAEANPEYLSSGNKLSSYVVTITFDSNGIASKMENIVGDIVLFVISRSEGSSSSISGYELPILIGLTAITSVSIIFIMKKKMLE